MELLDWLVLTRFTFLLLVGKSNKEVGIEIILNPADYPAGFFLKYQTILIIRNAAQAINAQAGIWPLEIKARVIIPMVFWALFEP